MRNCLILGCGRSGTSMVAGLLAKSGYFMGDSPVPPNPSNPKGFFEDIKINKINEALLRPVLPRRFRYIDKWFFRDRLGKSQRWLARLPLQTTVPCSEDIASRIKKAVETEPYCFKDPRFCYTLPAWRPFLKNTAFVCVFREPGITAKSILKDCQDTPYLQNLSISFEQAVEVWTLMYEHVLERHMQEGDWLFLHYDQVLQGLGLDALSKFLGAPIDASFPDTALKRTTSDPSVPPKTMKIYERLCGISGMQFSPDSRIRTSSSS